VLADALGGNSKTVFIGCISPSLSKYEETLSTLLFCTALLKVKTFPTINEDIKVKGGTGEKTPPRQRIPSEKSASTIVKPLQIDSEESPKITFINQQQILQKPKIATPEKNASFQILPEIKQEQPNKDFEESKKVNENQERISLEKMPLEKSGYDNKSETPDLPLSLQIPVLGTVGYSKNIEKATKIIKRLGHTIRYLKGEVAKKVYFHWLVYIIEPNNKTFKRRKFNISKRGVKSKKYRYVRSRCGASI